MCLEYLVYKTLASTKIEVFEAHKQVSGLISYVCQILFSTTQIWPMLMKCSRNKKNITSFIFNRYLVDKNHSKRSFIKDSGGLIKKFLFLNSKANPKSDLKMYLHEKTLKPIFGFKLRNFTNNLINFDFFCYISRYVCTQNNLLEKKISFSIETSIS